MKKILTLVPSSFFTSILSTQLLQTPITSGFKQRRSAVQTHIALDKVTKACGFKEEGNPARA
jgi:hypothetical protein